MFDALVISTYLLIVVFFIIQIVARKKNKKLNPLILPIIALAYHFIIDTSIKLSLVFVYNEDIDPIGIVIGNIAVYLVLFGGIMAVFCALGIISIIDNYLAKFISIAACVILLYLMLNFNYELTVEYLTYDLDGIVYYSWSNFRHSPVIELYFWSGLGNPIADCLMLYVGMFNNKSTQVLSPF